MKFAALIAAASAGPTDPQQWFIEEWWRQAVGVFNFASSNWSNFAAAVNSVSDHLNTFFLSAGLNLTVKTYVKHCVDSKSVFKFQVDDAKFQPLWTFCNDDGNDNLSAAELTACGKKSADYMGMNDQNQNFLYDFAGKYWNTIDQDGNGELSR